MRTPRELVTRQSLAFVEKALPVPCSRLLEIGCGEGDLALSLARDGRSVVGLDTSPAAVTKARDHGVDAHAVDWMGYVSTEPFDAIVFVRSLHHMEDLEAAVDKTVASLRPGGRVIVDDFAFVEVDEATTEWIRSVLRMLKAAGRVDAPGGTQASRLLADGAPLELWFEEHHDIHPAPAMEAALGRHYRIVAKTEAPYLYRYLEPCLTATRRDGELLGELLAAELRAIALGVIRPMGRRFVAEKP